MNPLSSEHHTEDTLEAKLVWADSEPPSADPELSLQDAAHTWQQQQWQSLLLGVCGPWMDRSLARVHSSTVTDAVSVFQFTWSH